MLCPQCQAENREGRRFCSGCGAPLPQACPACGFPNEPGANFCGGCGVPCGSSSPPAAPRAYTPPHLAERILSGRRALEGERKHVTVLFADLKGSLELLANRDPEDARKLLDPVLERMMEAVHQYEGTVNQVMGDGIMALFGAPVAHEDHAIRAGYAALKMQQAISTYARQSGGRHDVEVQIRVGLNSGEVVVRGIGNDLAMDYSAVGQTTHLAARMEQVATPGTILVTEAFARLTEGRLHFKPMGLVSVKGLGDPVDVLELVDAEPTRGRFQAAVGRGFTRFVGRTAELTAFRRALDRARAGHGQAVAVIGDPGVGKSRLFYEFIDSDAAREWLTLETGSVSYGKVNAFLPLRDLLRGYFQIEARDEPDKIEEKLNGRLLALDESLHGTLPVLRSLLDVPVSDVEWEGLDPPQRRQRILDGVKRLLVRQSQLQPLLLIFENLHWIDAQTQAFLDSLMESLPTARILLLVNYRPEYQHTWGNKTYYTQLRLDPLPADSAQELLHALLGAGPDLQPLKQLLIERTEGNPFFLEESVRTLVEQQVLVGARGSRRLAKALSHIQVPATVQAILAARIDHLPAEDKRLLQCSAVIGRDLSLPLLRAVAGLREADLQAGLARLQAREFLYETSLFPEIEYTFKHALTQEVAYGSLLQERRRALHAKILEVMESLYADRLGNYVDRLAHHALQGGVWERAIAYYQQAGTKAALRSAYREAVACFEQALLALRHLPVIPETRQQAFDLRMAMRTWLVPLGDYQRILDNLREAEAIADAQGDHRRLGLVHAYMTDYFRLTGDNRQAMAFGERALTTATGIGDFSLQILANLGLGHACHAVGDYRRAVELLGRNVELLTGELVQERFGIAGLPSVLSRSFMVFSLTEMGEFATAHSVAQEAVQIAELADTAHGQALAKHSLGLVDLIQGNLDLAIPVLEETYRRCQVGHIPLGSRLLASALGYGYALAGRLQDAAPLLEQAVRQAEVLGAVFRLSLWLTWLGETYLLLSRREDAFRLAETAIDRSTTHNEPGHRGYALRLRADIAASQDRADVERALDDYQEALTLAVSLGMRPLQGRCLLGLGSAHHRVGQLQQSRTELAEAVDVFRSIEMVFWTRRAEELLAGASARG
jgi:class 3 adenylate cyclase/tetratricopeptide (TPR) repeat protein